MAKASHRININVADIRIKPKFKSERVTQALYNEPIELLKDGDDYCRIRLYDGFEGFVKKLFISENGPESGADYIIKVPLTPAYTRTDLQAPVITLLPFASLLRVTPHTDGFMSSHSPRYGDIYVKCADLIPSSEMPSLTKENVPILLDIAHQFMGVPYLWGGRSYFGVDCSGYVAILLKYIGIKIPRKTKDQAKFGRQVPYGEIEVGDLLFFRIHVGIALNRTDYIHASLSQGGVHINTLDPNAKGYLRYRDLSLRAVRRFTVD
jgi:gamma-D-glutamyl-L-lysine dipeptidyl-peptidase